MANEVTITLDHSHIHMRWPPLPEGEAGPVWVDGIAFINAILAEQVAASSGWIDGRLRIGSLHPAGRAVDLHLSNLQRVRTRSWRGTFDQDRDL